MKRIAVLTSGGDAPGMNAAIRAVTRTALAREWQVFGVYDGYAGLMGIQNDTQDNSKKIKRLKARSVGGIIQQAGTILGSARAVEFKEEWGRKLALANLEKQGIEALVVIGGNGSQTGAHELAKMGFPVVGIASTIDNDLAGSEMTLGVDTALNIALEAIDRLKITANSHHRAFLVEVMGRGCGYLALMAGIAGGAEAIVIPERELTPKQVEVIINRADRKGKKGGVVVVAEGAKNNADKLLRYFKRHEERVGFEMRSIKLGHVQRGGAPGAFDRLLGTRFGAAAVKAIEQNQYGVLVGLNKSAITLTPLVEVAGMKKEWDTTLLDLSPKLDAI